MRSSVLPLLCALVAAMVLLVGTVALAPRARAFERQTVDRDPSIPLFWRYRTVIVRPAYDSCADLPADAVQLALSRASAAWNLAGEGCSDFRIEDGGPPLGASSNLDGGEADEENRIAWRETAWPDDVSSETLALTTLVYRRSTGEIVDADIDLNGVHHYWTDTEDPGRVQNDVQNTLTHELGHLLGLAHVADPEATMYRSSSPGDLEKRTLAEDDVAALCYVYPLGRATPDSPMARGMGLTGCAAGPRGSAPLGGVTMLGLYALSRRRRRR